MHACVVYVPMCVQMHIRVYAQRPTEACESCPTVSHHIPLRQALHPGWSWACGKQTQAVSFLLSPSLVRLAGLQAPGIPLSWPPQSGIASMHHHIQVFTGL